MWPKVGTNAGRPHQKAERLLQPFACYLFGCQKVLELGVELRQFVLGEANCVDVQVKLPSAPEDAVPEVDLAPGHWREDGLEKDRHERELLGRGWPV